MKQQRRQDKTNTSKKNQSIIKTNKTQHITSAFKLMKRITATQMDKSNNTSNSKQLYEEFEDAKGVIIIRISKKNRQHNGQKKKYKRTNNDLQNTHQPIITI